MSNAQNDKIKEALYEDFCELFDSSRSFRKLVYNLFTDQEMWMEKEYGKMCEDALTRVVEYLWHFDADLLLSDKRTCVEAYIMYQKHMSDLHRLSL